MSKTVIRIFEKISFSCKVVYDLIAIRDKSQFFLWVSITHLKMNLIS